MSWDNMYVEGILAHLHEMFGKVPEQFRGAEGTLKKDGVLRYIAFLESTLAEKDATIEAQGKEIERLKLFLVTETDSGFKKQVHIDRLQSQLTALRDQLRWIKIEEGLPEEGVLCILSDIIAGQCILGRLGYDKDDGLGWFSQDRKLWTDLNRFTHYRIIEPPKGDGK